MKILIDAHMVGQCEGGNERYISSLIGSLGKYAHISALVSGNIRILKGAKKVFCVFRSNLWRYLYTIPKLMYANKYDFVLTTYFVSPLVFRRNIIMLHDLLYLRHPEYFSLKERIQFLLLSLSIRLARVIIVPSQFVAKEFNHYFPNIKNKLFVVPEAADAVFVPKTIKQRALLRRKYNVNKFAVLVMGSRYAKRPIEPVLEGLLPFSNNIEIFVLMNSQLENYFLKKYPDVRIIKKLSDKVLCDYYNLVDIVIYPSRYEGFGLPILEVMQCGTSIVTNKIDPIVEMAGSVPHYFDLDEPSSLTRVVRSIMSDKKVKKDKILEGYKIAKRYSWNTTALAMVKIGESL